MQMPNVNLIANFLDIYIGAQYINCTCNIDMDELKEKVKVERFKPKKLYESFIDVLKYSNYKILKCYKLIGSKRMITHNIGNIILIIFLIVYLYSLLSYICRGIDPLKGKLINEVKKEGDEDDENKIFHEETKAKNKNDEDDDGVNKKRKNKKRKSTSKRKSHYPPKKREIIN